MAKSIIVKITCDRCKTEGNEGVDGSESVSFAYDGYSYGLDLCPNHAEEFHNTIQDLIATSTERERVGSSRRTGASSPPPPTPAPPTNPRGPARRDKEQLQAIRDWANSHGFKVSNRGRIPGEVEAAYQAAFQR